ncbi:hypothetical protein V8B97DRAFT_198361 [Scleroderma yunnanense]
MENDSIKAEATAPRTLVLCFDGTHGQFDSDNTNVVKLFALLHKDDVDRQRCYYQPGVGTYFQPGVVSPLFAWWAKLLDEAIAWYLDEHVMDGYKFLMRNYCKGDKICLFGFSRGAYTARALAGMLTKVGLLPLDNLQTVSFAYKLYKRIDKQGVKLAANFKKEFCREVNIEFVGVWDTVQSTGMLISRSLPFTDGNTAIRTFRHALSLDEHRAKFRPNLYHRSVGERTKLSQKVISGISDIFNVLHIKRRTSPNGTSLEYGTYQLVSEVPFPSGQGISETDVLEVWFAGCHGDIGGGNVEDDVKVSLAQITLRWMIEQIIGSSCGILFDDEEMKNFGITMPGQVTGNGTTLDSPVAKEPGTVSTLPKSDVNGSSGLTTKPIPSSDPEFEDAIAQLFDSLQIQKAWWLLEIVPLPWSWQDDDNVWHVKWSIHLGKGRIIPYKHPKFHHTVKLRMDYKLLNYKPRAIYDGDVKYV